MVPQKKNAKFVIKNDRRDIERGVKLPYSLKQHRLFEAVAHDPAIAAKRDIPQAQAAKMASEGVKDAVPKIRVRLRRPETPPAAEPPKVEQPEPLKETVKPEATKEAESDSETKKLKAKLAQAKEILEKAGEMPEFLRKGMELEISMLEDEILDQT